MNLITMCIINFYRGVTTMHTVLRLPDVKRSTGLSLAIYLRITRGTFPKPVSLGGRAVGWLEAEVQQWLERRIEASRSAQTWGQLWGRDAILELKTVRGHQHLWQQYDFSMTIRIAKTVFEVQRCRPEYRKLSSRQNRECP